MNKLTTMDCPTLAALIQQLEPQSELSKVARLCLLVERELGNGWNAEQDQQLARLRQALRNANLVLQATADQRAAVADELVQLAKSDPEQFSQEQIWVLVRAIKVLTHTAHLYAGDAALDI